MRSLACALFSSSLLFGCQSSSSDLEGRVAKLEAENAKYKEALDFLQKVYNEQKAAQQQQQQAQAQQRQQQEEMEPDPSLQFAVDITPDIKAGQVEGPSNACVTIVEAWDFA